MKPEAEALAALGDRLAALCDLVETHAVAVKLDAGCFAHADQLPAGWNRGRTAPPGEQVPAEDLAGLDDVMAIHNDLREVCACLVGAAQSAYAAARAAERSTVRTAVYGSIPAAYDRSQRLRETHGLAPAP